MQLTIHLQLVPKWRVHEARSPLPPETSQRAHEQTYFHRHLYCKRCRMEVKNFFIWRVALLTVLSCLCANYILIISQAADNLLF